ncbi:DUF397 domain-containing protein [Streptomyces sp. NPDC048590]|uniref:DUF397 domain-containing protein n=1 Tax=Streptomyces sp. NPDC048590 TaxID=3365574 RepID=UPI003722C149
MTTTEPVWFKSSYSGSSGDNCVEVAFRHGSVLVRDSKVVRGPTLEISPCVWAAFTRRTAEAQS